MRRIFQYLIFILIFLSLSITLNWYIFSRLSDMLIIPQNVWYWLGLGISSVSFMFTMYGESRNILSRIVVVLASVWLGVVVITLFMVLAYDILQIFIPMDPNAAGKTILILVGVLTTVGVVNAQILRTRTEEIKSTKLKSDKRIVHISDLHLGSIYGRDYFLRILKRVKELKPNLIMITGDVFDSTEQFKGNSLPILDELDAQIILITGNHEFYAGIEEITEVLKENRIRFLRNETISLNDMQIVGIDYTPSHKNFEEILKRVEINPNKYTILMHHQPMPLEEVNKRGVDLMLAGHTHGGQVFPFTLLAKLVWRYSNGLYKYRDMYINTSSGTGTWGPPMRLGTNNEITLIKLKSIGADEKSTLRG